MAKNRAYHKSSKQIREDRKRAQRKAFIEKNRKQLIIAAIVAVVAIVAIAFAVDYFYMPGGSLRQFMGKVYGVEDNMVVREMNGNYYEFARMDVPEGFKEEEYTSFTAKDMEKQFYFAAEDENRAIDSVYVVGVKEKTGEHMVAELTVSSSASYYSMMSEPRKAQIAGFDVNYFYAQSDGEMADTAECNAFLVMYVDTIQGSSVLVNCSGAAETVADLPTEEAMLAEAENILSSLTLPAGV